MASPWDKGFVEVADRCFVARYRELDVSVGVVVGADGALVLDSRDSLRHGLALAEDVRRLPGGDRVRWLVNTHEHFDHVLGNGAFPHASIHAHETAADRMVAAADEIKRQIRADPSLDPEHPEITAQVLQDILDTEPVPPTHTFSSAATIDLGNRYVELLHLGRGHTGGDLVLHVPDADLLFAGDLIEESPDRDATPGFGDDCYPLEWATTLDLLIGIITESSTVIPGHGSAVGKDFVQRQHDDIADLAEMIRVLASQRVPLDEALTAGEQVQRPAPLAAMADPSAAPETGWPFPARFLDGAVRRGYAHLRAGGDSASAGG